MSLNRKILLALPLSNLTDITSMRRAESNAIKLTKRLYRVAASKNPPCAVTPGSGLIGNRVVRRSSSAAALPTSGLGANSNHGRLLSFSSDPKHRTVTLASNLGRGKDSQGRTRPPHRSSSTPVIKPDATQRPHSGAQPLSFAKPVTLSQQSVPLQKSEGTAQPNTVFQESEVPRPSHKSVAPMTWKFDDMTGKPAGEAMARGSSSGFDAPEPTPRRSAGALGYAEFTSRQRVCEDLGRPDSQGSTRTPSSARPDSAQSSASSLTKQSVAPPAPEPATAGLVPGPQACESDELPPRCGSPCHQAKGPESVSYTSALPSPPLQSPAASPRAELPVEIPGALSLLPQSGAPPRPVKVSSGISSPAEPDSAPSPSSLSPAEKREIIQEQEFQIPNPGLDQLRRLTTPNPTSDGSLLQNLLTTKSNNESLVACLECEAEFTARLEFEINDIQKIGSGQLRVTFSIPKYLATETESLDVVVKEKIPGAGVRGKDVKEAFLEQTGFKMHGGSPEYEAKGFKVEDRPARKGSRNTKPSKVYLSPYVQDNDFFDNIINLEEFKQESSKPNGAYRAPLVVVNLSYKKEQYRPHWCQHMELKNLKNVCSKVLCLPATPEDPELKQHIFESERSCSLQVKKVKHLPGGVIEVEFRSKFCAKKKKFQEHASYENPANDINEEPEGSVTVRAPCLRNVEDLKYLVGICGRKIWDDARKRGIDSKCQWNEKMDVEECDGGLEEGTKLTIKVTRKSDVLVRRKMGAQAEERIRKEEWFDEFL